MRFPGPSRALTCWSFVAARVSIAAAVKRVFGEGAVQCAIMQSMHAVCYKSDRSACNESVLMICVCYPLTCSQQCYVSSVSHALTSWNVCLGYMIEVSACENSHLTSCQRYRGTSYFQNHPREVCVTFRIFQFASSIDY
jgi:hypothetical protein